MNKLAATARIAKIAMWIMIGVIVLSFFVKSRWITIVWIVAAAVCLISTLMVAYNKRR